LAGTCASRPPPDPRPYKHHSRHIVACHDSNTARRDSTRPLVNLPLAATPRRQSRLCSCLYCVQHNQSDAMITPVAAAATCADAATLVDRTAAFECVAPLGDFHILTSCETSLKLSTRLKGRDRRYHPYWQRYCGCTGIALSVQAGTLKATRARHLRSALGRAERQNWKFAVGIFWKL
jgi:hypothetical protein